MKPARLNNLYLDPALVKVNEVVGFFLKSV